MNISEDQTEEPEDVEEMLRSFLECEFGFLNVRTVEIQLVHPMERVKTEIVHFL